MSTLSSAELANKAQSLMKRQEELKTKISTLRGQQEAKRARLSEIAASLVATGHLAAGEELTPEVIERIKNTCQSQLDEVEKACEAAEQGLGGR